MKRLQQRLRRKKNSTTKKGKENAPGLIVPGLLRYPLIAHFDSLCYTRYTYIYARQMGRRRMSSYAESTENTVHDKGSCL